MFRTSVVPAAGGRPGCIAVGLLAGVLTAAASHAQTPPTTTQTPTPTPSPPPQQATAQKSPYVFAGDGAVILNFVKPDKTADFELVMGKVKEALSKSEKPERKQQAASWKVFKANEPGPGGSVIYVMIMDPAVKGTSYSVGDILSEAFPSEVQALYKSYSEAYGQPSQNILNLNLVSSLVK